MENMKENVYNVSKLAFHREKLDALARGEITAPIYVRIKPTNKCDHHCSYCSYEPGSGCPVSETINRNDQIDKGKMLEILDDFKERGVKAVTYSGGGEPLVYPWISEIMRKTLENGIDLSIITNGQKLRGESAEILTQAEWVRVSSSESDPETFSKTRKVHERWFYELADNLRNFAKIKKESCEFGINFVVHEGNANQVYRSVKYFKELGVNHVKITPCYTPNFLEYHQATKDSVLEQIAKARKELESDNFTVYDTYDNDFKLTGLSERTYSKCYVMQIIPVIGADSIVYFCHDKTYTKNGALGSIKNRSFKELWFSKEALEKFKKFNPQLDCRHHCTADSRNLGAIKMINDLNNLDKYKPLSDKHKNFV